MKQCHILKERVVCGLDVQEKLECRGTVDGKCTGCVSGIFHLR